jgi:hypothetical protein
MSLIPITVFYNFKIIAVRTGTYFPFSKKLRCSCFDEEKQVLYFPQDFLQPIITPYELEFACDPERVWGSEYFADFRSVFSKIFLFV